MQRASKPPSTVGSICRTLETGGRWAKHRYAWAVQQAEMLGLPRPSWSEYQQAKLRFRDQLRALVDEWLDAGRNSDGSEEPSGRNVSRVNRLRLELHLGQYMDAELGPSLEIRPGFKMIEPFRGVEQEVGRPNSPGYQAQTDAIQSFLRFMQSEERFRFAKCRYCGRYFVGGRRLHPFYKRGVNCPTCRNKVSAIASTTKSKQKFLKGWIEIAAGAWNRWGPKDGDRIVFVTSAVNKRLGAKTIARNSVTRHLGEIKGLAADEG